MAEQSKTEFLRMLRSLHVKVVKTVKVAGQPKTKRLYKTADLIRQARHSQRTVSLRPGMTVEEMLENARCPTE